tara:strand:+ start:1871 stop:2428 length:558 start_codon:yes stop_codon:yes gene_type:complete
MATNIKTDIAAELNITARRNDTFKFELQVTDPAISASDNSKILAVAQGDSSGENNQYQAKMTIVDATTGDAKLKLYSARWTSTATEANSDGTDVPLSATSPGEYYGDSSDGALKVGGAIDFSAMDDNAAANRVVISAPYTFMAFEPGEYNYDLQIRYALTNAETVPTYTTWLYGKFILTADITQL